MNTLISILFLVVSGLPVAELYQLHRYEEVIERVSEKSSLEDRTLKAMSYYHLSDYSKSYQVGQVLFRDNKSDSLKFMVARSAFMIGLDDAFDSLVIQINSEILKTKLYSLYDLPESESSLKSELFNTSVNNGFCFVDGKLLQARNNELVFGDDIIYESPGKFVGYPFYSNGKLLFCSNLLDGREVVSSELSTIGRDRISRLQLFIADFNNGKIDHIEKLSFNNLEYDFISPFLDQAGVIYFSSNLAGGYGGYDIYRVERNSEGWGQPENLGTELNSKGNDISYYENGNTVYYSSERSGSGKLDLFIGMKNSRLYWNFSNCGQGVNSRLSEFNFVVHDGKGYYDQMNEKGEVSMRVVNNITDLQHVSLNTINSLESVPVNVDEYQIDYGRGLNQPVKVGSDLIELDIDKRFSSSYQFTAYGFKPEILSNDQLSGLNSDTLKLTPWYSGVVEDFITGMAVEGVTVFAIKGNDTLRKITGPDGKWFHAVNPNDGWHIEFSKNGYKPKIVDETKMLPEALQFVAIGMDTKKGTKLEIRNIYFAFGKADIEPSSIEVLDRIVEFMNENSAVRFELSAHTDSRGSDPVNLKLSNARAIAAQKYLIEKGIAASRLIPKGYGEKKPVNNCVNGFECSEEDFQLNRRVEIIIL